MLLRDVARNYFSAQFLLDKYDIMHYQLYDYWAV